jgi:hypothetical protein
MIASKSCEKGKDKFHVTCKQQPNHLNLFLVSLTKIHYLATILALFRLLSVLGSTRKIVQKRDKYSYPKGWILAHAYGTMASGILGGALLGPILVLIKIQNHPINWPIFPPMHTKTEGAVLNYLHAISQPKKKKRKHYASIRIST